MDLLTQYVTGNSVIMAAIFLIVFSLAVSFALLFMSGMKTIIVKSNKAQVNKEKEFVASIAAGIPTIEKNCGGSSKNLRDTIVQFASNLISEDRRRLQKLYEENGFCREDLKELQFASNIRCAEALKRNRDLLSPLPDYIWKSLLARENFMIRWATLEYIASLKGKRSLPWILQELNQNNQPAQGATLHILSTLASMSPETISALAEHSDNPFIVEICLRCMAAYPLSLSHSDVLHLLNVKASKETFISVMKILKSYPSKEALAAYPFCMKHPHWVVRLEVANGLALYTEPEAAKLLSDLCLDGNYYVRAQAVKSLLAMGKNGQPYMVEILEESKHPAHEIAKGLRHDSDEFHVAA